MRTSCLLGYIALMTLLRLESTRAQVEWDPVPWDSSDAAWDVITSWDPGVARRQTRLAVADDVELLPAPSEQLPATAPSENGGTRRRVRQRYNGVSQGSGKTRGDRRTVQKEAEADSSLGENVKTTAPIRPGRARVVSAGLSTRAESQGRRRTEVRDETTPATTSTAPPSPRRFTARNRGTATRAEVSAPTTSTRRSDPTSGPTTPADQERLATETVPKRGSTGRGRDPAARRGPPRRAATREAASSAPRDSPKNGAIREQENGVIIDATTSTPPTRDSANSGNSAGTAPRGFSKNGSARDTTKSGTYRRAQLPVTSLASKRRKPTSETRVPANHKQNLPLDIDDDDNYPEEFKQKILGTKKETESTTSASPRKVTLPPLEETDVLLKAENLVSEPRVPAVNTRVRGGSGRPRSPETSPSSTPFPRRRSTPTPSPIPTEPPARREPSVRTAAAIRTRGELLRKSTRGRTTPQPTSLVTEDATEAIVVSSSESSRYSARQRQPETPRKNADSEKEEAPAPFVQRFSAKYRSELRVTSSSTPAYAATVPSVTTPAPASPQLPETDSTHRLAKFPILSSRILSTRQASPATSPAPPPEVRVVSSVGSSVRAITPNPNEAATPNAQASSPAVTFIPTPATTPLIPKVEVITPETSTQKIPKALSTETIYRNQIQDSQRLSTIIANSQAITTPKIESLSQVVQSTSKPLPISTTIVVPLTEKTMRPATTQRSTTVVYTNSYAKVASIGLNPATSPLPSVVLTSRDPEIITPPPRFAMRIPIAPPGTKSSTPVPVTTQTLPTTSSITTSTTTTSRAATSSTTTSTSTTPRTTSTSTTTRTTSTSTTPRTTSTTPRTTSTSTTPRTTSTSTTPRTTSTSTTPRTTSTSTTPRTTSTSTTPRTTSTSTIPRTTSTSTTPRTTSTSTTPRTTTTIINTTTPRTSTTSTTLPPKPKIITAAPKHSSTASPKLGLPTPRSVPENIVPIIRDNEISQSAPSPSSPPAGRDRAADPRGLQFTNSVSSFEASTTQALSSPRANSIGSNSEDPLTAHSSTLSVSSTEPNSNGTTTERSTYIYKIPPNPNKPGRKGANRGGEEVPKFRVLTTDTVPSTAPPRPTTPSTPSVTEAIEPATTTQQFRWKPVVSSISESQVSSTRASAIETVTARSQNIVENLVISPKDKDSSVFTVTPVPVQETSTTEFEGLSLANLAYKAIARNRGPSSTSSTTTAAPTTATPSRGRKVPVDVVPIISDNTQTQNNGRRPSRTRSSSTTTTSEAPTTEAASTTKGMALWVVPKSSSPATTTSTEAVAASSTSLKGAENALGGITAQDLLLLELLSKRRPPSSSSTSPEPQDADFGGLDIKGGLDLATLLAAGDNVPAFRSTTRRPRVTSTTPAAPQYEPEPNGGDAAGGGGSGSNLYTLLRLIGGLSSGSGPQLAPAKAPAPAEQDFEQEEIYLEPATTKATRTRGRPRYPAARRPTISTTTEAYVEQEQEAPSALVTVAINVTKTVASLMGRVLQGAARTVSAVVRDGGRVLSGYLQTWQQAPQ